MEKTVLAGANSVNKKYFFEPLFGYLPESIKDEIRDICVVLAEKLNCTFVISFYENGDIVFEIVKNEGDVDFDDIGADLEIKILKKEKNELIKALKLWYVINMTDEGRKAKSDLIGE